MDLKDRSSGWLGRVKALVLVASLAGIVIAASQPALAQESTPEWLPAAKAQADQIPPTATNNSSGNAARAASSTVSTGSIPATIPQTQNQVYGLGVISSYQPGGSTVTAHNAFFGNLGINGRTCFSCHLPQNDWSISPAQAQLTFISSHGTDPLFRLVDGAVCPNANTSQPKSAYSLLLNKGLFRIFLPLPPNAEFTVSVASDPYGCENNSQYGLPAGLLSLYRRPLPATNLEFLTKGNIVGPPINPSLPSIPIMWDGREPTLISQFNDATLIHAQASGPPTTAQEQQGAAFQTGIYTAPIAGAVGLGTNNLTSLGANGGPVFITTQNGNNDLFGDPFGVLTGTPQGPDAEAFNIFDAWVKVNGSDSISKMRESIYRGEQIFDNRTFTVNGVSNFPNPLPGTTCGGCHNITNVGMNVVLPGLLNTGVADDPAVMPHTSDLPLFNVTCTSGSRTVPVSVDPSGSVTCTGSPSDNAACSFQTDDLGAGLIDGQCNDLSAFKAPSLRGISARPPFFHDGSAATLTDVVNFYSKRMAFDQPLSAQDKTDLVNFLNSL